MAAAGDDPTAPPVAAADELLPRVLVNLGVTMEQVRHPCPETR